MYGFQCLKKACALAQAFITAKDGFDPSTFRLY
jgi:hypothetical protein